MFKVIQLGIAYFAMNIIPVTLRAYLVFTIKTTTLSRLGMEMVVDEVVDNANIVDDYSMSFSEFHKKQLTHLAGR